MTLPETDSPDDVPEGPAAVLEESNDGQLRGIINHAQQLLRNRPPISDTIESRYGEELLRVEDRGAYTMAVVERPDKTSEARGPFVYRVKWEPHIDDEGGRYRWHYLERVCEDAGGNEYD